MFALSIKSVLFIITVVRPLSASWKYNNFVVCLQIFQGHFLVSLVGRKVVSIFCKLLLTQLVTIIAFGVPCTAGWILVRRCNLVFLCVLLVEI